MTLIKTDIKKVAELEKKIKIFSNDKEITHGLARAARRLLKELRVYQDHIKGIEHWKRKEQKTDIKKIQVGGGKHYLKGFFNIDIVPPADLVCDVREGLPLRSGCAEFIFAEHFLEHVDYPISVKKFVRECFRVLEKKGKLVVGVPDSKLAIKSYLKKDQTFYKRAINAWYLKRNCLAHFNTYLDLINYHLRDQDDDEEYTPHFWAYDFEKLKSLLKNAGFLRVEKWKFDSAIANPERKWGSCYVMATK